MLIDSLVQYLFTFSVYSGVQNPDMTAMSTLVLLIYLYCFGCSIFIDLILSEQTKCANVKQQEHI